MAKLNKIKSPKKISTHKKGSKKPKIKASDYGTIGLIKENKGLSVIAEDLKKRFLKNFPKEKDLHFFSHTYTYRLRSFLGFLGRYKELYEYLDLYPHLVEDLTGHIYQLGNPELNRKVDEFNKNFSHLKKDLHYTDPQVTNVLNRISKKECFRLYEAMKCLDSSSNFAAVVMAVSAVENRLHKLLKKANQALYKREFEKTALGGIIELFRRDTRFTHKKYDKLKKILPDKHKPLMEMLNMYRIFSAHPMEEKISNQTAKAIVSFSFLLLIDEQLKIKE